jgi:hypothetical protein
MELPAAAAESPGGNRSSGGTLVGGQDMTIALGKDRPRGLG